MSTNPILIGMAVRYADQAPTMASALSTSSFNLGTAVGSWIAGFAFASSLGATGPVLVGTGVAALYFLPLIILLRKRTHEAHHRRSRQLTTRSTVAQFVSRPSATAPDT